MPAMYGTSYADAEYKSRNQQPERITTLFSGDFLESSAARLIRVISCRPARIYRGITNLYVFAMTRPDSRRQPHLAYPESRLRTSPSAPSGLHAARIADSAAPCTTAKVTVEPAEQQHD